MVDRFGIEPLHDRLIMQVVMPECTFRSFVVHVLRAAWRQFVQHTATLHEHRLLRDGTLCLRAKSTAFKRFNSVGAIE